MATFAKENDMKTDSPVKASGNCCDGKVVKVAGNKLTSTCAKGDEHNYTVAEDAKVNSRIRSEAIRR